MVSVSLLEIILHVVTHVNQMLTMYVMYCTVICTMQYSVVRTAERVWVVGIELGTHKSDPKERVRQFFCLAGNVHSSLTVLYGIIFERGRSSDGKDNGQ